jgi:hypothetical protein
VTPYTEFPDLANVYLEDSYVLAIDEAPHSLTFTLEVVLTPEHPRYHTPLPGEQYCYVDGFLTLNGVREIEWLSRSANAFTDASGEEDLGNIDTFRQDVDYFDIVGDWGHVHVFAIVPPTLVLKSSSDAL